MIVTMKQHQAAPPAVVKVVNPLGTVVTLLHSSESDTPADSSTEDAVIHENCDETLFRPVVVPKMTRNVCVIPKPIKPRSKYQSGCEVAFKSEAKSADVARPEDKFEDARDTADIIFDSLSILDESGRKPPEPNPDKARRNPRKQKTRLGVKIERPVDQSFAAKSAEAPLEPTASVDPFDLDLKLPKDEIRPMIDLPELETITFTATLPKKSYCSAAKTAFETEQPLDFGALDNMFGAEKAEGGAGVETETESDDSNKAAPPPPPPTAEKLAYDAFSAEASRAGGQDGADKVSKKKSRKKKRL